MRRSSPCANRWCVRYPTYVLVLERENGFNDQRLETACDMGEMEKGTGGVVGRTLLHLFEETLLQTRSL